MILIRPAVIFTHYGPYHIARGRALAEQPGIDPNFIELAAEEKLYPWVADRSPISERLVTLAQQEYESCQPRDLSRRLIEKLDEVNPDAVVIAGYSERPMRAAAGWARAKRKHVVMMSDSTKGDYRRHWWRERLKRGWISRNVDAGFVAGRAARAYLSGLGVPNERIWERYDVVDNHYFATQVDRIQKSARSEREKAGLPEKYFVYVGRFSPEKNLPGLLEAYKLYKNSVSDPWGLVLVGDGPQRQDLESAARAEGLHDIIWPGFKYIDELPIYYALANCFVLPSIREPWGLVVNEALASGLPVLVSNACGCSPDLVREGKNGYTFAPSNLRELAELMGRISILSTLQLKAMSQTSHEIVSDFTPEHWAHNLARALTSSGK